MSLLSLSPSLLLLLDPIEKTERTVVTCHCDRSHCRCLAYVGAVVETVLSLLVLSSSRCRRRVGVVVAVVVVSCC